MEQKNLVPKRRFKEFQNAPAWEQRKLGKVVKTHQFRPYLAEPNAEGDFEVIQQGDRPVAGYTNGTPFENYRDVTLFGDHTVSLYKPTKPFFIATDGVKILSADGLEGDFLFSLLERYKPEPQGYKRHFTILKNQGAWITKNVEEQVKIGAFFKNLDHLITLHQCKLEKMKTLKSAYLSEMFPAEGERVPKRRFAGFTQAWEQRKLGDVAEFNPKEELPEIFEYVDLESVVGTELIAHRKVRKEKAPSRAQRLARKGDLFYQTVRPYQKNNYLFEKPCNNYVFSTGYAQLRPYGDGYFLLSLVQTEQFVKAVLDRCTGTSYPAINSNDLANMEVYVPSRGDEQILIGRLFKSVDHLITLHQRKLEKLQNIKEAYLNEMFV
ncbi:hypothetical protein Bcoa_1814 [Heyndrickxia coagulans 36D1]|uniref:Type I restriction modification DNA specificity domain-containing protein n=2 Tax=Heyndrickxia coagulans TaxID=1398 RepID=G2TK00_HEYCO|nr:restriction endonuclease subunit S [Heyndrickxia coagulans]AEP01001.1 hypothetical protein Bcoa_1814 [Heyndrickxia coagulans 36D1]